ncbi:hypothetical protein [Candidatus Deferrimicrobium sp.]
MTSFPGGCAMDRRKRTFMGILWMMGLIGAGMAVLYIAVTHA